MSNITRPTTTAQRAQFAGLTADQRIAVRTVAIDSRLTGAEAWAVGFASLSRPSGVAGKRFQRAVGHRLVTMRSAYAVCSCGTRHKASGSVAQRSAHASHKAKVLA